MRLVPILSVIGFLLLAVGIAMLTALPFSYYYGEADFQPILYSALITMTVGILLMVFMRKMESDDLRVREGFAIVTFGWLVVALFGSLPFLLSGTISSFTDAFFETMSGFTTTGASILTEVEKMPHGLLYWRALSHWLGGMGIIVLSLAVLPLLGIGGMQLFRAEVSGPTKDKLTPRITETARLLWGVYVLLTAVETGLLMYGGMSFFDALCHAFATISTGGFSTKNASLATYDSAYFDWVITIFMFIGGTNFALHYSALRGKIGSYLKDNEFVFFFVSTVVAIILVTASIQYSSYDGDVLRAVRYAAFNVVSVMSCTGFSNADFAVWAPLAQVVLFFMMFPGASAGSTGGGLKNIRVLLLLKTGVNELKKLVHPKIVAPVRYNRRMVDQDTLFTIGGFFILYLVTFSTSSIILTATGLDVVTSMSAVAASMANVGPGLGTVGPMSNYAHLTDLAKWVLSACMLLGRLEIFTVFALFSSAFWKR